MAADARISQVVSCALDYQLGPRLPAHPSCRGHGQERPSHWPSWIAYSSRGMFTKCQCITAGH